MAVVTAECIKTGSSDVRAQGPTTERIQVRRRVDGDTISEDSDILKNPGPTDRSWVDSVYPLADFVRLDARDVGMAALYYNSGLVVVYPEQRTVTDIREALRPRRLGTDSDNMIIIAAIANCTIRYFYGGPPQLIYGTAETTDGVPAHFLMGPHPAIDRRYLYENTVVVQLVIQSSTMCKGGDEFPKDMMLSEEPAPSYLEKGRALVEMHHDRLIQLSNAFGGRRVVMHMIGHGEEAGTAVVAFQEWKQRRDPRISVAKVVGFQCPSLLSQKLLDLCPNYVAVYVSELPDGKLRFFHHSTKPVTKD
jgi:hypothetical protein